jgi:Holliday junction resolvase
MAAESKLQGKIRRDLKKSGWKVIKIMLCSEPGTPDLFAGKSGRMIMIEAKDEGEQPEPLQLHRHREWEAQGFMVFVIDTWECYMQIKYNHL